METSNKQLQRGIICSAECGEHSGKYDGELGVHIYISAGDGEQLTRVAADLIYWDWANEQGVPACEPFGEFKAFCDSCFDTDEKKQAFIDHNLENPSGGDELEHDYYKTVCSVWDKHYIDGIKKSKDYFWDTFVEESVDEIAKRLILRAENEGFIITKSDLAACSEFVPCFKNLTVDTPPLAAQKSEDYTLIEDFYGSIDQAVEVLERYKRAGEKARLEFNGVMLYSDTVTLDGAYEAIVGKNKADFGRELMTATIGELAKIKNHSVLEKTKAAKDAFER